MAKTADTVHVQALLEAGAQVIEVLPRSAWRKEHLPGARCVPLPALRAETVAGLDPTAPTVVYCYNHECDLSSRAAARLEALGFTDVYDYAASKTAWLGEGLASEGELLAQDRVGHRAWRPPTCGPGTTIKEVRTALTEPTTVIVMVVVDDDNVVLGALHPDAAGLPDDTDVLAAADPGPSTVRPSISAEELAARMDDHEQHHVIVTTSHGRLLGVVRREDLD